MRTAEAVDEGTWGSGERTAAAAAVAQNRQSRRRRHILARTMVLHKPVRNQAADSSKAKTFVVGLVPGLEIAEAEKAHSPRTTTQDPANLHSHMSPRPPTGADENRRPNLTRRQSCSGMTRPTTTTRAARRRPSHARCVCVSFLGAVGVGSRPCHCDCCSL